MIDIPAIPAAAQAAVAPTQGASVVPPIAATITSIPDKIQQLIRQIQVNATVASAPENGLVTLNSTVGLLTLQLSQLSQNMQAQLTQQLLALFQSQKPLTAIIQPGNPPTQAFLLLPPATGNPQQAASALTSNLFLQSVDQPRLAPTIGLTLSAVVLPPNAIQPSGNIASALINAPYTPIVPEDFPPTTSATAQPETAPQQPQAAPNSGPQTPLTPAAQQTAAPPSTTTSTPISVLLQAGNIVSLRIDAVDLPSQPVTLLPDGPNQIVAKIVSSGTNGQLILKAGDNTLFVNQPIDLPAGARLLLTVETAKSATPVILPNASNFTALQETLAALTQIDPSFARQIIETVMPQPNAALPGALLFFMSAIKQGNLRSWLGDNAIDTLLNNGKMELLGKAAGELSGGQTAQDNIVGEWKTYPLPLYNDHQLQMLSFYVHGNHDRNARGPETMKPGADHIRFVIDMRMSMLGSIQIDGFVKQKKLDMIVRSENHLPEGLHNELRQTYIKTLGAIDYAGSLNFQVGRQHWLNFRKGTESAAAVVT